MNTSLISQLRAMQERECAALGDMADQTAGRAADALEREMQRAEAAEARVKELERIAELRELEQQTAKIAEDRIGQLEAQNARLRAALEDQLKLAEKQVEFYKDRVDSGEEHLRPFGSEAWRRAKDLKKALNGEEAST